MNRTRHDLNLFRENNYLKIRDLADQLKTPYQTLGRFLKGNRPISSSALQLIFDNWRELKQTADMSQCIEVLIPSLPHIEVVRMTYEGIWHGFRTIEDWQRQTTLSNNQLRLDPLYTLPRSQQPPHLFIQLPHEEGWELTQVRSLQAWTRPRSSVIE